MPHESPWDKVQNLLCIRLGSMGDVLMTTPALRALKEGRPGQKITLLASPSGAEIAPLLDMVDETILYEPPWTKASDPAAGSVPDRDVIDRLRGGGFDGAVIFTAFSKDPLPTARLAYLAEVPLRLGHSRENPSSLLTHGVREFDHAGQPTIRHEVRRQLDLVAAIGCRTHDERLSLEVSPESVGRVVSMLMELGLDIEKPWLVVHPGAPAASRRYPAELFAEAARQLAGSHGLQVLFTGTQPEVDLVEEIRHRMQLKSFSLAGRLDLKAMSALLFLAPLLISNNTGPVHMAAALQTPVVVLYALTDPQQTPWRVPHRTLYHDVPCKFCYSSLCPLGHHDCLRRVAPGEVVHAALDLMEETWTLRELGRLTAALIPQDDR